MERLFPGGSCDGVEPLAASALAGLRELTFLPRQLVLRTGPPAPAVGSAGIRPACLTHVTESARCVNSRRATNDSDAARPRTGSRTVSIEAPQPPGDWAARDRAVVEMKQPRG